jgi:pimeloyl-ACP methyl ester carboxylesterase
LTDVPFGHIFQKPNDLSSVKKTFLNDSPAGLAAWIVEKFCSWSDCGGDIESRFSKDELLTHVMIYWATQSIGSSFLPYYDYSNASPLTWIGQGIKKWVGSKVPAAFALFPKDISRPPREWADRFFNVQRWTEMPRGGHFAAMEEPELLAADMRTWFRGFAQASSKRAD